MNFEKISTLIFLIFTICFLWQGINYPMGTLKNIGFGFFPKIVIFLTLILCVILLLKKNDR